MFGDRSFVQILVESLGLKRKLTNLFQVLAVIMTTVPVLMPFSGAVQSIASYLGIVAVSHSVAASTFKMDIHSVAAFFSALLLAAQSVPQLAPYAGVIQAVAAILSTLATASFFSRP